MEYDLIGIDHEEGADNNPGETSEKIFLTLWKNPFISADSEKIFARDHFANFTLSLMGFETEFNFSKSVISGLSNKICQMLIKKEDASGWSLELKIDPQIFAKGMKLLAGVPRVSCILNEIPELYCLLSYLDIFDTSFKALLMDYILKNCTLDNILTFIDTFNRLGEPDFLEKLSQGSLGCAKELRCSPIREKIFEKILEYHENLRLKALFGSDPKRKKLDFMTESEIEILINKFVEDSEINPSNRTATSARLMDRFLSKEKKNDQHEQKSAEFLKEKNALLEENIEKLTQFVVAQKNVLEAHDEQIQKLYHQIEILAKNKKQAIPQEQHQRNNNKIIIKRAMEITDTANWKHEGAIDAVCFQVNQNVKLTGIELCLPGEKGITAAGEIAISEWDFYQLGREIAKYDIELEFKDAKSVALWLNPIVLEANRTYCITSKMFGGPTFACKTVSKLIAEQGVEVIFMEPYSNINGLRMGSSYLPGFYLHKLN